MHLYQLALQGYEKKQNQTNIIATKTFQDLISLVKDSFIDNFTSFLVLATLFIQKSWYIINNLSNKSQSNYRRSLLRCSLILISLLFNLEGKRYVKEVCSKKSFGKGMYIPSSLQYVRRNSCQISTSNMISLHCSQRHRDFTLSLKIFTLECQVLKLIKRDPTMSRFIGTLFFLQAYYNKKNFQQGCSTPLKR